MSDIPKFFGMPEKDTVTADYIIQRMDTAAQNLEWTDAVAYNYFMWLLRESALDWLKSMESDVPNFAKRWTFVKPLFKKYFGDKLDKTQLLINLRGLKMSDSETPMTQRLYKPQQVR